jgi:hypothetical protein
MRYCSMAVDNPDVPCAGISLAWRFIFSRASRFIRNFIWEYFLKTCVSPPAEAFALPIRRLRLQRKRTGTKRRLEMFRAAIVCGMGFLCAHGRLGVVFQEKIRPLSVTQGFSFLHYVKNVVVLA